MGAVGAKTGAEEIVGGAEVEENDDEAQSVVMIYGEDELGKSFICTGTFISDRALITVAHCIPKEVALISLFFGPKPLENPDTKTLNAVSTVIHPAYQPGSIENRNDIALIFFERGLPKGAKIAKLISRPFKNQVLKILGYGQADGELSTDTNLESGVLRSVEIGLSKLKSQDRAFDLDQTSGVGVCFGDSGGPAFSAGRVYAIASAVLSDNSDSLQNCKYHSVFMKVEKYLPWITSTLRMN